MHVVASGDSAADADGTPTSTSIFRAIRVNRLPHRSREA